MVTTTVTFRPNLPAFHIQPFLPLAPRGPQSCHHQSPILSAARPRRTSPRPRRSTARSNPNAIRTTPPLTSTERLQKVLSHMGVASRRAAEELIVANRVRVNGRMVNTLGVLINPYTDVVTVDGEKVELPKLSWLAVHKPRGVLSVAISEKRSISDFVPKGLSRGLVAVAPIEEDSSGLVILTNDRACAADLSKPENGFVKEWIVDCEGVVPWQVLKTFREGVELTEEDGRTIRLAADVQLVGSGPMEVGQRRKLVLTRFEVRVRDNRRHVIRRMFETAGYRVFRASRKSFGPVLLGSLKRGESRLLIQKEIKALKRGLSKKTMPEVQRE